MNTAPSDRLKLALQTWSLIPQAVLHQGAWWACVLWMGWVGPAFMAAFLVVHFAMTRTHFRRECAVVACSTLLGLGLDNALASSGMVIYVGDLLAGASPVWLVAIWAGFGATLHHCQFVLVRSRRIALATGALGGPLAYWGGQKLARLTVVGPEGWMAVSALWTIVLLILHAVVQHQRHETKPTQPSTA